MERDVMATAPAPAAGQLDPKVVRTALILVVGLMAVIFDTTIVSVALHTLALKLHTSVTTIQWVSTGYLLALGIAVPLSTWGLQRFGGKRLWMFALAVFLIGSIGSSLAWNVGSLIGWRVVQGIGGGLMLPLMTTLIFQARHLRRPAGAARPDPRPAHRRRHPDPPQLAVHVLGERAVLHRGAAARLALPCW
jgi:predicted MFS family arabinose efflux permease